MDIIFGWPNFLFKRIRHPIVWIGNLISFLDKFLNKKNLSKKIKLINGIFVNLICLVLIGTPCFLIEYYLSKNNYGIFFIIIFVWPFLATKSMYIHIREILLYLKNNDIQLARVAVSKIVGRDTKNMNKTDLVRSSIESLAENTSDAVIAPIFWTLLLGLPGIVLYKIINTLDSMIGYRNKKYKEFGFASAKVDDLANFFPARITGFIFSIFFRNFLEIIRSMVKDGSKHTSLNAGYPEAAMAVALNVKLGGARFYNNRKVNSVWLNIGGKDPKIKDLERSLVIFIKSILLLIGIFILLIFIKYY